MENLIKLHKAQLALDRMSCLRAAGITSGPVFRSVAKGNRMASNIYPGTRLGLSANTGCRERRNTILANLPAKTDLRTFTIKARPMTSCGGKIIVRALKYHAFGDENVRLTRKRCARFFEDDANFM